VKDKLENKLHDMVCDGEIGLHSAQRQIASSAGSALLSKLTTGAKLNLWKR